MFGWDQIRRRFARQRLRSRAYRELVKDDQSYLHTTGWMETLRRQYPCRPDGSELPWMNYPVIAFLERRLTPDLDLFEYGSGYSTLFFARHVRSTVSVEHDRAWHDKLQPQLPANARLLFVEMDRDGRYCRSIHETGGSYDFVVVDGRDRVNCLRQAVDRLTARGVVLLDDSQREEYAPGIAFARERGFSVLDFEGLKPTGKVIERTTLFYRRENCLGI